MPDEMLGLFRDVAESGLRVKLAPGVIGKSAMMWLGTFAVWVVALWRISPSAPWWYNVLLLFAPSAVTVVVRRETQKMRDYAAKNPATALMEGADITAHHRFEAQSKELGGGGKSFAMISPSKTTQSLPGNRKPDQP